MEITRSAQYNDDGKHDGTYIMSAGPDKVGIATKHENPSGKPIKFTFEPNDSSPQLTECEAPTMKQLKAKILKQLL